MNVGYELSESVIILNIVESFGNDITMDFLYPMIQEDGLIRDCPLINVSVSVQRMLFRLPKGAFSFSKFSPFPVVQRSKGSTFPTRAKPSPSTREN
jgi:hypothetical protein